MNSMAPLVYAGWVLAIGDLILEPALEPVLEAPPEAAVEPAVEPAGEPADEPAVEPAVEAAMELPYSVAARTAQIAESLQVLRRTSPKTLEDTFSYLNAMERNHCRSAFYRLRVECLIDAATRSCRGHRSEQKRRACLLYSDLVVLNKLSETRFVSVRERYAIMKNNRDFRPALRRQLMRRFGSLAAAFRLSQSTPCEPNDDECLASAMDEFCLAATVERNLSWQHCAAALIWFIGTTPTQSILD